MYEFTLGELLFTIWISASIGATIGIIGASLCAVAGSGKIKEEEE